MKKIFPVVVPAGLRRRRQRASDTLRSLS